MRNCPRAKCTAAQKLTNSPKNVSRLGLMPVAAIAPTILSSSQRLPSPIQRVNIEAGALFPDWFARRIIRHPARCLKRGPPRACAEKWGKTVEMEHGGPG